MNHRFQLHLEMAHNYWKKHLSVGDTVIDATCGNGHDTLKLCQLVLSPHEGFVFAYDIQPQAIAATKTKLAAELSQEQLQRVILIKGCHSNFSQIPPQLIRLIIYNLGYLPGGNKALTTLLSSTLKSVRNACELAASGGLITITCYPGHQQGEMEEQVLLDFCSKLPKEKWSCCHHRWINRERSPSLLVLHKRG